MLLLERFNDIIVQFDFKFSSITRTPVSPMLLLERFNIVNTLLEVNNELSTLASVTPQPVLDKFSSFSVGTFFLKLDIDIPLKFVSVVPVIIASARF